MTGLLNIRKPSGPTSHDIVAQARRILGTRRIGHSGTLDPMASGVLLLCLGTATRLVEYLSELPKRYEAVAEFGIATTTQDTTGDVVARQDAQGLACADVEAALSRFRGEIWQTPPMVSAVKHQGRRLYELARAGEEVERAPRPVTIFDLEMVEFLPGERPRARLVVLCSSGTYVRTLIHDLGAAVGTGAAMASLVRTAIGPFTLEAGVTMEELAGLAEAGGVSERLIPLAEMVAHLPAVAVPEAEIEKLLHGGAITVRDAGEGPPPGGPVRLMAGDGEILAIGRWAQRDGAACLVPVKVLRTVS